MKRRYRPEIVWSDKSWTHNVFRAYEKLFGRRIGIRAESSARYAEGKTYYKLYTFEALCAFIETWIRNLLGQREWVRVEQLQFAGNPSIKTFPRISFAIALDATATSTAATASPFTWSHTVTGSNPLLAIGPFVGGNNITQATATAVTYNSVSATKANAQQFNGDNASHKDETSIWLLGSTSTGANTISVTATGLVNAAGSSTSYSGCQSTNTADATGTSTGTTTGAKTFTVTTVADNCWIYAVGGNDAFASQTLTATQTGRGTLTFGSTFVIQTEDTNAAQTPAGAKTVGFTVGGTIVGWGFVGASFAPASAGGASTQPSRVMQMGMS